MGYRDRGRHTLAQPEQRLQGDLRLTRRLAGLDAPAPGASYARGTGGVRWSPDCASQPTLPRAQRLHGAFWIGNTIEAKQSMGRSMTSTTLPWLRAILLACAALGAQPAAAAGITLGYSENGNLLTSTQVGEMCQFVTGKSLVVSTQAGETRIQPNAVCPPPAKNT